MSHDLDPRLQQIIENAHVAVSDVPVSEFSFPRVESRTALGRLGDVSSRLSEEYTMLNGFSWSLPAACIFSIICYSI
jgi:hypothetical protein